MPLRLIQRCAEFIRKEDFRRISGKRRGIYVLYRKRSQPLRRVNRKQRKRYDGLYIGMTDASVRWRLRSHARRKKDWTHFSIYEAWPNITEEEIRELEGLFRHIYRYDGRASILNRQRGFKAIRGIRVRPEKWQ